MVQEGSPKYLAAEVCKTMNSHWGMGKNDISFMSPVQVVELLCHSRGCGANLLLNIGPEPQGGIPEYEKALLRKVGQWLNWYGKAVYDPRPAPELKCSGRDFILRNGNELYYFAFDIGIAGNADVTAGFKGPGLRTIDKLNRQIISARWMDNGEQLDFVQNKETGISAIKCTGFPYGTHTGVRVMNITLK